MDSFYTIIIIAIVLFVSVAGIGIVQKKEHAKAALRQQIAKYRYRASETVNILDNFSSIPIGEEARTLLIFYIKLNLTAAKKLAPADPILAKNLENINHQLQNPQSNVDKQRLVIPKDSQQLNILIKQLSKLGQYLLKFKSVKAMPAAKVPLAINRIMLLIAEAKICAYIQHGKKALTDHNYVNAQRNFQTAQQMLDKFTNKDARLITLESELKELANLKLNEAANKSLSIENEQNNEDADNDNIFGPRKKW